MDCLQFWVLVAVTLGGSVRDCRDAGVYPVVSGGVYTLKEDVNKRLIEKDITIE